MATVKNSFILLGLLCWWFSSAGQPVLKKQERKDRLRQDLVSLAESQLYVREATGNNDGPEVKKYLKTCGLKEGNPWCAAFVTWLHLELNIPAPESAWSPDWFKYNLIYKKGVPDLQYNALPGAVFGLYYEHKKRVAHVGLITGETKFHYSTIEGNANSAGSNNGGEVCKLIRKKETIYLISDYVNIDEYFQKRQLK